jgi:hypothetical protein
MRISKLWFKIMIGLSLVLSSILIYYTQIMLFHDPRNTLFYLFQDIAFVPLQVFIVTLIVEGILSAREKRETIRKMHVVISAFYSEVGTQAIAALSSHVGDIHSINKILGVKPGWKDEDFRAAVKSIKLLQYDLYSGKSDIGLLKTFLKDKRHFMLSMFENTNLLEHDTFTDMLWAIFHVSDELESRESLDSLPEKDLEHLSIDIKRAYGLLIIEWLYYMNHLKKEYPYLFSLAVRKSPFNESDSVIIR